MDKLFLLSLFVLYLSGDGESGLTKPKKDYFDRITCHVCRTFRKGICVEGANFCEMDYPSACVAKLYYRPLEEDVEEIYAKMYCIDFCEEFEGTENGVKYKIFCCRNHLCNKPRERL